MTKPAQFRVRFNSPTECLHRRRSQPWLPMIATSGLDRAGSFCCNKTPARLCSLTAALSRNAAAELRDLPQNLRSYCFGEYGPAASAEVDSQLRAVFPQPIGPSCCRLPQTRQSTPIARSRRYRLRFSCGSGNARRSFPGRSRGIPRWMNSPCAPDSRPDRRSVPG